MKNQDFGNKLVDIRKVQGLTQKDVAEKCNITVRTIQRIESGIVTPRAYTLKIISDALGFDFFETSEFTGADVKIVNQSSIKKRPSILWYLKDLFNLKTNAMRKLSILTSTVLVLVIAASSLWGQNKNNSGSSSGRKIGKNDIKIPREIDGDWFTTDGKNVWALGFRRQFRIDNKGWDVESIESTEHSYIVKVRSEDVVSVFEFSDIDDHHMEVSRDGRAFGLLKHSMEDENSRSLPFVEIDFITGTWVKSVTNNTFKSDGKSIELSGLKYRIIHLSSEMDDVNWRYPGKGVKSKIYRLVVSGLYGKQILHIQYLDDNHIVFKDEQHEAVFLALKGSSTPLKMVRLENIPHRYLGKWNGEKNMQVGLNKLTFNDKKYKVKAVFYHPSYLKLTLNKKKNIRMKLIDSSKIRVVFNQEPAILSKNELLVAIKPTKLPEEITGLWYAGNNNWCEVDKRFLVWNNEIISYFGIQATTLGYRIFTDKGDYKFSLVDAYKCELYPPEGGIILMNRNGNSKTKEIVLPEFTKGKGTLRIRGYVSNFDLIKNQYFVNFERIEPFLSSWTHPNIQFPRQPVDRNGAFDFELNIDQSQIINFRYGLNNYSIWVQPGQDIFMRIDGYDAISMGNGRCQPLLVNGNFGSYTNILNTLSRHKTILKNRLHLSEKYANFTLDDMKQVGDSLNIEMWQYMKVTYPVMSNKLQQVVNASIDITNTNGIKQFVSQRYYQQQQPVLHEINNLSFMNFLPEAEAINYIPGGWSMMQERSYDIRNNIFREIENMPKSNINKTIKKLYNEMSIKYLEKQPANFYRDFFIMMFISPSLKREDLKAAHEIYEMYGKFLVSLYCRQEIQHEILRLEEKLNKLKIPK